LLGLRENLNVFLGGGVRGVVGVMGLGVVPEIREIDDTEPGFTGVRGGDDLVAFLSSLIAASLDLYTSTIAVSAMFALIRAAFILSFFFSLLPSNTLWSLIMTNFTGGVCAANLLISATTSSLTTRPPFSSISWLAWTIKICIIDFLNGYR
jgi:hypothetical protein